MKVLIFANSFHTVSGGDVIAAEFAKNWGRGNNFVNIITNEKGLDFFNSRGISRRRLTLWRSSVFDHFGVYLLGLFKTIVSAARAFLHDPKDTNVIFAYSVFWPDMFPAIIAKLKNPEAKLVIGIYVLFPNPFRGEAYHGGHIKGLALYISQLLSMAFVDRLADCVFTSSEPCKKRLLNGRQLNEKTVLAVRGGVDVDTINKATKRQEKYDLIYYGRFHSQKGIIELLQIWKEIIRDRKERKLLLLGKGPMKEEIEKFLVTNHLEKTVDVKTTNIETEKYSLIKQAKVFFSASRHDTGNIALDEVLACGVPGVIYDLPDLYYPTGVVKVPVGNHKAFVKGINDLLGNVVKRKTLGEDGYRFIRNYSWGKIAGVALKTLEQL